MLSVDYDGVVPISHFQWNVNSIVVIKLANSQQDCLHCEKISSDTILGTKQTSSSQGLGDGS